MTKKKPSVSQFPIQTTDRAWHTGGAMEMRSYAQSLQKAAKILIATLDAETSSQTTWDACPIVFLYKQAVELHLKALVSEGGNFLKERTDSITLRKTHSLRWLTQIACRIIRTVQWEDEFQCEGVASLAEFSALIDELESLDPVALAAQPWKRSRDGTPPQALQPANVVRIAKKLDALLELSDVTADALAAAWPDVPVR